MKPKQVQLTVDIIKQGKSFVAYSPALDISTTGKTQSEARKKFQEIVDIFFEEVDDKRTLKKALTELGWKQEEKEWKPPVISQKSVRVEVPA